MQYEDIFKQLIQTTKSKIGT